MSAPLTLIVDGKPLVFDVPVPVGEVIPAGTIVLIRPPRDQWFIERSPIKFTMSDGLAPHFTARPPVAPESFADGDVAWVRIERDKDNWKDATGNFVFWDAYFQQFIESGDAVVTETPRPESLADVLDDANLPDELRARIEKAVGA